MGEAVTGQKIHISQPGTGCVLDPIAGVVSIYAPGTGKTASHETVFLQAARYASLRIMEHDHDPKNRREAISRKGWQRKDWRLIKLGELPEWRSQRTYGDEIIYI